MTNVNIKSQVDHVVYVYLTINNYFITGRNAEILWCQFNDHITVVTVAFQPLGAGTKIGEAYLKMTDIKIIICLILLYYF